MFIIVRAHILGFTVKYDQQNRVHVIPEKRYSGKDDLAGLCGNFNGFDNDDFRKSSNEMADNALTFASSWADPESTCEEPTESSPCASNPERLAWAQKGKKTEILMRIQFNLVLYWIP